MVATLLLKIWEVSLTKFLEIALCMHIADVLKLCFLRLLSVESQERCQYDLLFTVAARLGHFMNMICTLECQDISH